MPSRNSNNDKRLIAAREGIFDLLHEVAAVSLVAKDVFIEEPRWAGRPGPDSGSQAKNCEYPHPRYSGVPSRYWQDGFRQNVMRGSGTHQYADEKWMLPKTVEEGHEFHTAWIQAWVNWHRGLRGGGLRDEDPENVKKALRSASSPRRYIDDLRGSLRYTYDLGLKAGQNNASILMETFGMLKCVPDGPVVEDRATPVTTPGVLPTMRRYQYIRIVEFESTPRLWQQVSYVAQALRNVFDAWAVALMPPKEEVDDDDKKFLQWLAKRDWSARQVDVVEWATKNNMPGATGMGAGMKYLRKWCDKPAGKHARQPWVIRPEAKTIAEQVI